MSSDVGTGAAPRPLRPQDKWARLATGRAAAALLWVVPVLFFTWFSAVDRWTEANAALLVANDDESCETEALAALHNLRHAVDVDQLVDELAVPLFTVVTVLAATVLRTFLSHIAFRLSFAED